MEPAKKDRDARKPDTQGRKQVEKIEREWEKKDREREKHVDKGIERIVRDREKERELRLSGDKDIYLAQRGRLRELFGEIDKEFQILWEENQELRRRLEDVNRTGIPSNPERFPAPRRNVSHALELTNMLGSRLPTFKKDPEWEMITHFVGHRDGIFEVSTCKWDKNSFATASADRTARIWTWNGNTPVYVYLGHKGSVNSVRFHPSNRLVCTASGDNSVHVWRIPKPEEKEKKDKEKPKTGFDLNSSLLSTQGYTSEKERSISPPFPSTSVPIPITNPASASASAEPTPTTNISQPTPSVEVTDVTAPQNANANVSSFGVVTILRPSALDVKHKAPVIAADWLMPDSSKIVSVSWDNTVKVWSLENGKALVDVDIGHDTPHYVTNVAAHPKEYFFLTSSTDCRFRMWDIRTPQSVVSTIPAHTASVLSASFVPLDEHLIVSGSDDNLVKIWDQRNMRVPRHSIRCSDGINRFAVSPLSSNLVLPMDDVRTKVCDINGKQLGRIKSEEKYVTLHSIICPDFVSQGHKLMLSSAAWSLDDSVIYTTGFDKTVIAWASPPPSHPRQSLSSSRE